jgi:hypothetical protein
VGGQVDPLSQLGWFTRQFEGNGKARAIAISTIERRPSLPEVPTIAEGVPALDLYGWYGIFASRKTPLRRWWTNEPGGQRGRCTQGVLGENGWPWLIPVEPMNAHDFKKLYLEEIAQFGPLIKA